MAGRGAWRQWRQVISTAEALDWLSSGVPAHPPRCKPGLALAGTGLSRSPGCLCSSDEQQFKSNTRPSLLYTYSEIRAVLGTR